MFRIAIAAGVLALSGLSALADTTRAAILLPAEREIATDSGSGAQLIYLTSSPESDTNLYFHQRSWVSDNSLLLFRSVRSGRSQLCGYVEATGELVLLESEGHPMGGDVTASRRDNVVYVVVDGNLTEWRIQVTPQQDAVPTQVTIAEHVVGKLPQFPGALIGLNENSDGTLLVIGFSANAPEKSHVVWVDRATGEAKFTVAFDGPIQHVQASWETPALAMFAGSINETVAPGTRDRAKHRMWLADGTTGEIRKLYPQVENELVTHEQWWVDDQVVFCTGVGKEGDAEEAHVKVIDVQTNLARIICPGSWWPGGTAEEVSARNWWHCTGAPTGRFVAADNWHGMIAIASGTSARHRILTSGHRTYGRGEHPHVGWDNTGTRVVFATNRRGNPDVCIAELPEAWLSNCEQYPDMSGAARIALALQKVHGLVEQLEDDPEHVRQVCKLALELFDQTVPLHCLGAAERAALEAAALLHDTGYRFGASGHHKRSRDIILAQDLAPFTKEEQAIIACIARYHRKAHPASDHSIYRDLPEEAQRTVSGLAALLRIADGLDRSHSASVHALKVTLGEKTVTVEAQGASALDLAGAARKQQLFEQRFGKNVKVFA